MDKIKKIRNNKNKSNNCKEINNNKMNNKNIKYNS